MSFDVPKVFRSPGCDHGHDEESRNGRYMKIDILDDYIRTPEWFRGLSDIYRSTGGLPEPPPPRGLLGLMGPKWWKRRGRRRWRTAPLVPISPGTFPVSKYSRPIYRSSCLDHFETPRHVRDHIRDSEKTSVHQNL